TLPKIDIALVFSQNIDGAIRASTIDHDVFEIWIALQQDRSDGFFDETTVVVAGRYDANFRPRHPIWQHLPDVRSCACPRPSSLAGRRSRELRDSAAPH